MKQGKVVSLKVSKGKEESKRPSQTLFMKERIDPTVYLSYYTLNTIVESPKGRGEGLNCKLPFISMVSTSGVIAHTQPKQRLVEDLLLTKKRKKPIKVKAMNNTFTLNTSVQNVSPKSNSLKKNLNLKLTDQCNSKRTCNSNQTTLTSDKNLPLIKTEPQQPEKILLPQISELPLTNQKSQRERSNSIASTKSNTSKRKKSIRTVNYSDFVTNTRKNRKSSRFASVKNQSAFDSMNSLYQVENRIVNDMIGKTYQTHTSDDGFSFFFLSTGNFHCPLFNVFGVVEGNGRQGRQIASIARANLHTYLTSGITYGFKTSTVSENEIYESIIRNNYEPIRFVNERLHDDIIKSNLDIETSGASITVIFIIGKKLLCLNVGDVRAIAFLEIEKKNKETFQSLMMSSLDVKRDANNNKVLTNALGNTSQPFTGIPAYFEADLNEDYLYIIIASQHFWDSMTYGNVFKFMSTIQTDNIILKAEQIMDFKRKQNELYNRKNLPYSFCLIEF